MLVLCSTKCSDASILYPHTVSWARLLDYTSFLNPYMWKEQKIGSALKFATFSWKQTSQQNFKISRYFSFDLFWLLQMI